MLWCCGAVAVAAAAMMKLARVPKVSTTTHPRSIVLWWHDKTLTNLQYSLVMIRRIIDLVSECCINIMKHSDISSAEGRS